MFVISVIHDKKKFKFPTKTQKKKERISLFITMHLHLDDPIHSPIVKISLEAKIKIRYKLTTALKRVIFGISAGAVNRM